MKIVIIVILSVVYFFLAFSVSSIMPARIFLFLAVALFIWGYLEYRKEMSRQEEEWRRETEKELLKFPHSQCTVSSDYLRALLLDEQNNRVFIVEKKDYDEEFKGKEVKFHEIYEAALVEDNNIITLFSKGGFLGGSLIDEGRSSIIHIVDSKGESEKNEEAGSDDFDNEEDEETVSKISLKLVVDDLKKPIVEYSFLETEEPILKDSEEYKMLMKECNEWLQKFSIIIKRYERESVPVSRWE